MTIVFLLSSEASLFPLFSSQPQKETLRFHAQRKLKKKKEKRKWEFVRLESPHPLFSLPSRLKKRKKSCRIAKQNKKKKGEGKTSQRKS